MFVNKKYRHKTLNKITRFWLDVSSAMANMDLTNITRFWLDESSKLLKKITMATTNSRQRAVKSKRSRQNIYLLFLKQNYMVWNLKQNTANDWTNTGRIQTIVNILVPDVIAAMLVKRIGLDTNIPKNALKIYPEILNFPPKNPSKNL